MHETHHQAAQQRQEQIFAFRRELQRLQQLGVLQAETLPLAAISRHHDAELKSLNAQHNLDLSAKARSLSLAMQIVSFLGAWALAASVFFFFYQYWGYLSLSAQLLVLVSAPLMTLAACYWIARIDTALYFAKLAAMISFACLVLNVSLAGAVFNLPSSPNALAVFAVYAALLAYALKARLLLVMALLSVFAFIGAQTATWNGGYWLSLGRHPEDFLLPAVIFFCLPSVVSQAAYPGFAMAYRVFSLVGFFTTVLVLSNWGQASYFSGSANFIEGLYQLLGFTLSAAVIGLGISKKWQPVMTTGNVFFALLLFTKFFDWWWDWLPKSVFFLLLGLSAVLVLVVFSRLRRDAQKEAAL